MRRFLADILALHFGRADRWWAWAVVLMLVVGLLTIRGGSQLFAEQFFWFWMALFAGVSALGVWLRSRGQKDD